MIVKIVRVVVIGLVLLLLAAIVLFVFARPTFNTVTHSVLEKQLGFLPDSVSSVTTAALQNSEEFATLSTRSQEVGEQVSKVLGASIQEAPPDQSLPTRAFEYGRYLYCQEVVKAYEATTQQ